MIDIPASTLGVGDVNSAPLQDCHHVASIVLNFNSESDLFLLVPQLAKQEGVVHSIIIVDNSSRPESIAHIRTWLTQWKPDAVVGTQGEVEVWVKINSEDSRAPGRVYFVTHHENCGYSAGNNIGIRLADALGADAVLIANPDMRIQDHLYLARLTESLFADDTNCVAASRILGLDGEDQNPLREPSFWEELFWPRFYLSKFLKPISHILPIAGTVPVRVPKVSGCCLLVRMSFLRETAYLDEGVFLYCEEPILAARVRKAGGHIVFDPSLSAVHAHVRSEKGNSSRRMLTFIKSRLYYLAKYSGYGRIRLFFLLKSYKFLSVLHVLNSFIDSDPKNRHT